MVRAQGRPILFTIDHFDIHRIISIATILSQMRSAHMALQTPQILSSQRYNVIYHQSKYMENKITVENRLPALNCQSSLSIFSLSG